MKKSKKYAFTLPEILISMGIVVVILSLVVFNFIGSSHIASLSTTIDIFVTDLQHQRIQSMLGKSGYSFGIFFEADRYTLFRGNPYNPNGEANFRVDLSDNIFISSVLFSNNQIRFASGSGEVEGFVDNMNTVTFTELNTGQTKTISINKLGSVVDIN